MSYSHSLLLPEPSSSSKFILQSELSPLLKILPEYERRFLGQFHRGLSLNSYVHESLISARKSFAQYHVQRSALQAVVSNLQDHFKSVGQAFLSAENKVSKQQSMHREILSSFDQKLSDLGQVFIHPSIARAADSFLSQQKDTSKQASSQTLSGDGKQTSIL